ncbi:kelch-like protein 10 [Rhinophrynus dorsalis]
MNDKKKILVLKIPYNVTVQALFSSRWNNSERNIYVIPGISPDMMRLIVQYSYAQKMAITEDNVEELLIAADQFNVMGIVHECCSFLESRLCLKNCISTWHLTGYCYCPELHEKAYTYILHNFEEMAMVSMEFLNLSVEELGDIIGKDDLNVKSEGAVFEAVLRWIGQDPENLKQHIPFLLSKVRLSLMQLEYFMTNVKSNDYVKDCKECENIVNKALKDIIDNNMTGRSSFVFRNKFVRPRLPYNILFATGGWSGGSPTNAIETYDVRADQWVDVTFEDESARAYHGAAFLNGFVYLIGGFNGVEYFNSVKRFDPVNKTWQEVAPMHSRRCYVSVTVLDNYIYAMGGFDGYVRSNTAERYNPDTNQWTLVAPMHEQRSDASATALSGNIYICGGFNGEECLFTAEVYSPQADQWTMISPMLSRRSGIGVMAYGERIYAVGGFDGVNRLITAESYNPSNNTWSPIPSMNQQRSNFGIEVVDGLLLVAGGFNGFTTTFAVEVYNERTNEWNIATNMSYNRSALSCCIVPGLPNVRDYILSRDIIHELPMEEDTSMSSDSEFSLR